MNYRMLAILGTIAFTVSGCLAPKGGTVGEKRQYVNDMRTKTLSRLYAKKPEAKQRIKDAAGYAVFAELATGTGIGGGGSGYGVVVDNRTGAKSYMRMIQMSGGIGIGLKHLRVIFLFHTHDALTKFIKEGWEIGTEAQATALLDHEGATGGTSGTITKGMSVYQMTEDGLYLRAAIHAKKFFPDTKLNED